MEIRSTSLNIDPEVWDLVKLHCTGKRKKIHEFVNMALLRYIRESPQKEARYLDIQRAIKKKAEEVEKKLREKGELGV